jgi:hypothetical protein
MQQQIVQVAEKAGAAKVHFMPVSDAGLRRDSCDGHYSMEDHKTLSRQVIAFLDENMTITPFSSKD